MEQVSTMDKKIEKTAGPNPLPTPEEPLRDSFDNHDGPVRSTVEIRLHEGEGNLQETDRYTPSSIVGTKRTHDEMDAEKKDSVESHNGALISPSSQQDWELFPESDPWVPLPPMVGATGKTRVGVIEAAYNENPRAYLSTCLKELAMMRQARKQAAEEKAQKAMQKTKQGTNQETKTSNKKRRITSRVWEFQSDQTPPHSPEDVLHEVTTPIRPTRARNVTPASNKASMSSLSTPPPTTPRRATPSRKLPETSKKAASRAPASKKPKPTKTKPKSSINDKQDAIKARLNKRYEDQGMNTAGGKGAHWLFEDAYIPSIDLDRVSEPPLHERTEIVQKEVKTDDPCYNKLHPKEVVVASWMRASASEYLTQKRRFFLGVLEWYRSGYPEVKRAHAQSFCNQDGNSTTYMHETFKRWGWFDRSNFPDDLIDTLPRLFGEHQGTMGRVTVTPATPGNDLEEE